MQKTYTQDEIWKIFETLPSELKEAVFSSETADSIFSICEKNEVEEVSRVAYLVGLALMGLLPIKDMGKTLQSEIGIDKTRAQNIEKDLDSLIFSNVRMFLPGSLTKKAPQIKTTQTQPLKKVVPGIGKIATKPSRSAGEDPYKEDI